VMVLLALGSLLLSVAGAGSPPPPHLFMFIVDDLGWGNVGWNRAQPTAEVHTPTMDELVAQGVNLQRFYVMSCCSPSRASVISGRLPPHVETWLTDPQISNPADTESGWAGIPRSMTGIAAMLKGAPVPYSTHAVGKWDAGMATPQHTPRGRGFDTSLVYFNHENDYWTRQQGGCVVNSSDPEAGHRRAHHVACVDLWADDGPAREVNASAGDTYEEFVFKAEALRVLDAYHQRRQRQQRAAVAAGVAPQLQPLFLYYAAHVAHQPYEVPASYNESFAFIADPQRRAYHAMVACLDDVLAELIASFKAKGMWENTLMVMSTDNGGPIFAGANNFPLRGGKYSDFEGGVRGAAFVSGGFVPPSARGTIMRDPMHLADYYTTFAAVAGVTDPTDHSAAAAGLPGLDGFDFWPRIAGTNLTAPRKEIYGGPGFLISGDYKLLLSPSEVYAVWTGPQSPNATTAATKQFFLQWNCSTCTPPVTLGRMNCSEGCLYDVANDPAETNELSAAQPAKLAELKARFHELEKGAFNPDRGTRDPRACDVAIGMYGDEAGCFWGPFAFLNSTGAGTRDLKL